GRPLRVLPPHHGIRDLANRRAWRFAEHRHKIIVELAAIDVYATLLRQTDGLRRRGRRLDENRNGDKPVGIYQMCDLTGFTAQHPVAFDDLGEAWWHVLDDPARVLGNHFTGWRFANLPVRGRRRKRSLDHLAIDLDTDLDVAEGELLQDLVALADQARLEQQTGSDVDPELVPIAQPVLGL